MRVAPATRAQAGAIAAVKAAGWRDTYAPWVPADVLRPFLDVARTEERIAEDLGDPANFALVAADAGGRTVGIATCLGAGRPVPLLDSLHVLAEARGAGIGEALVRRVAAELVGRGAGALEVLVVEQNAGAARLYERLGAARVGTGPADWAPGHVVEVLLRWDDLGGLSAADAAGDAARGG